MATTRSIRQRSRKASISYSHDLKTDDSGIIIPHDMAMHTTLTTASIGNAEHQQLLSILHAASSRDSTCGSQVSSDITGLWLPFLEPFANIHGLPATVNWESWNRW
jgi:hypothetical protein